MPSEIFATANIHIHYPYNRNFEIVLGMIKVFQMKFIQGGTSESIIKVLIPSDVFKRIFHENPIRKKYEAPKNSDKFIDFVEVTDIIIKEN